VTETIRRGVKRAIDACCWAAVGPAAAMCLIEAYLSDGGDAMFSFWAQAFALVPGLPGTFVRRAFYRWTLESCARTFFIGFGALFSQRAVIVEEDVYVGPYAIIGAARLRRRCLIGSRCSIPSGGGQHVLDVNLRWTPTDVSRLQRIEIGADAWLGEACVVLADVGSSAMVAAGSVVSTAVPPQTMVGGNPARFVRRLTVPRSDEEVPSVTAAVSVR
jgi:acetyltransferase-like isoleucine patch superfamily enzyme